MASEAPGRPTAGQIHEEETDHGSYYDLPPAWEWWPRGHPADLRAVGLSLFRQGADGAAWRPDRPGARPGGRPTRGQAPCAERDRAAVRQRTEPARRPRRVG